MRAIALVLLLCHGLLAARGNVFAASPGADLLKAKQDSEAKGYIFETNHDALVAKAKQEGKIKILSGLDPNSFRNLREAFGQKYPFLNPYIEEMSGTDAALRFLAQLKTGPVDWDVVHASPDWYLEYQPYLKRFDILSMAKHGVLSIPAEMIDPKNRNIVAMTSTVTVIPYNRKLLREEQVPSRWEDFLKPEFKGRKFALDIRPHAQAAMVPGMGLEWVLDYCRKLAAQNPIWVRGQTRAMTSVAVGEYLLFVTGYHIALRSMRKDRGGALGFKVIEPVPVRISAAEAVASSAPNPHAALLWLEFVASPEGQRIIDKYEPHKGSIFAPGSEPEKLIRGRKISLNSFDTYDRTAEWYRRIVEAFGFPKTDG